MTAKLKEEFENPHNVVLTIPLEDATTHTITFPDILVSDFIQNVEKEQLEFWLGHSSKHGDSPDVVIPFDDIIMDDNIGFTVKGVL